jgi:hypothetical protein
MYSTCPKCGHTRKSGEGTEDACPACGLIYAKYIKQRFAAHPGEEPVSASSGQHKLRALLLEQRGEEGYALYLRAALLLALAIYGVKLARMDVPTWEMASSLIHLPMVPIHEFGHIAFMAFGEFMHLLGGSLFQAGLPIAFACVFLRRRDPFAAAVMLWWSAIAVMDIAPYVYDAQQPMHVLLTGRTGEMGAHDFIDVLGDLGLLTRAQAAGYTVHRVGVAMLVAAIAWGAAILVRAWRTKDELA